MALDLTLELSRARVGESEFSKGGQGGQVSHGPFCPDTSPKGSPRPGAAAASIFRGRRLAKAWSKEVKAAALQENYALACHKEPLRGRQLPPSDSMGLCRGRRKTAFSSSEIWGSQKGVPPENGTGLSSGVIGTLQTSLLRTPGVSLFWFRLGGLLDWVKWKAQRKRSFFFFLGGGLPLSPFWDVGPGCLRTCLVCCWL